MDSLYASVFVPNELSVTAVTEHCFMYSICFAIATFSLFLNCDKALFVPEYNCDVRFGMVFDTFFLLWLIRFGFYFTFIYLQLIVIEF